MVNIPTHQVQSFTKILNGFAHLIDRRNKIGQREYIDKYLLILERNKTYLTKLLQPFLAHQVASKLGSFFYEEKKKLLSFHYNFCLTNQNQNKNKKNILTRQITFQYTLGRDLLSMFLESLPSLQRGAS